MTSRYIIHSNSIAYSPSLLEQFTYGTFSGKLGGYLISNVMESLSSMLKVAITSLVVNFALIEKFSSS